MLKFIKSFFGFGKQAEPEVVVEQPTVVKCGCGRSQSGNCEGLHALSQEDWAAHDANPKKVKPAAPAKKKPAGKKPAGDKKPSGDKKPRGPRKPKAPKAVKSA